MAETAGAHVKQIADVEKCWLESSPTFWDAEEVDNNQNKGLLFYAKSYDFQVVIDIIKDFEKLELLEDDNRRTAAHFAAMHQNGEDALTALVQKFGATCLQSRDLDNITPLHLSARYHSPPSWRSNFKLIKSVNLSNYKDSNGDTCAHWAAQNANDYKMVLTVKDHAFGVCWNWKNNREETVLHHVLQYFRSEEALKEILDSIGKTSDVFTEKDVDNYTVVHFAAKNNNFDAISILKPWYSISLSSTSKEASNNDKKETVLHLALKHYSEETAMKLIDDAASKVSLTKLLEQKDSQGNTYLHAMAQCQGKDAALLKAALQHAREQETMEPAHKKRPVPQKKLSYLSKSGVQQYKSISVEGDHQHCLLDQNKRKSTVLHYAMENCRLETVKKLLGELKSVDSLLIRDKDGNTAIHIAAKRKDKYEVLNEIIKHYSLTQQNGAHSILSKRNNKNQSVLHLAIDAMGPSEPDQQHETVESLIKKMPQDELIRTDRAGNTLLHSLMQSRLTYDGVEQQIFNRFMWLVNEANVNPEAVNNLSLNCLHATKLDASILCKLLRKVKDKKATKIFDKLLVNSATGAHVIHTFSGQYSLQQSVSTQGEQSTTMLHIIAKLSKVTGDPESQVLKLIKKKVNPPSCGNNEHGETCLHFACAYGHRENIVFLLSKGLSLWSTSHSGQTCVDFAFENGKFDDLAQAAREYNKKIQEGVLIKTESPQHDRTDPLTVSRDLYDSRKAIKTIDMCRLLDPPHRALKLPDRQDARKTLAPIMNEYRATKQSHGLNTKKHMRDKIVLIRALEMDSTKIFRSALSLDMVTRETGESFTSYFLDALKNEKDLLRNGFPRQNVFKQMTHVDAAFELEILDLAAFFYRDEIMPDLILTRQFELIPCCLSLLIHLGPKIVELQAKSEDKHEQLLQLQRKVTNIAMNALNELFINAEGAERELLFKYIKGELTPLTLTNEEKSMKKYSEFLGPKFPYRVSDGSERINYGSVLDLVKEADCSDLFATDCIYYLTKVEWREPISSCSKEHGCCGNCLLCSASKRFFTSQSKFSKLNSPKAKFLSQIFTFIVFLAFFGWYVINFQKTFWMGPVDAVLVAYFFSFLLQELREIKRLKGKKALVILGKRVKWVNPYVRDWQNMLDIAALSLLLFGLGTRYFYYSKGFKSEDAYPSQMILGTSYALFCFRSVSFLGKFYSVGPMISMLGNLIFFDLLPFLLILMVIFCSFGVFFTCLLFSFTWAPKADVDNPYYGWEVFVQTATLPFNLLFNNFDQIEFSSSPDSTKLGKVAIKPGHEWFYQLLIFIFLGLVNVVMMNLLIALFNLRVTQMYGVAIGIWRKKYFQVLQEYKKMTTLPPPFSFLEHTLSLICFINKKICKYCCKNDVSSLATCDFETHPDYKQFEDDYAKWWMDEKRYPADYLRFLQFQAIQFRRCRHRLLRDSQWNKNDFDLVTARTANELSDLKSELQEMLENFKRKEEDRQHRHDSPNDSKQKSREMDHSERTATPEYDLTQETQENRQIQTLLEELNERRNESVEKLTKLEERMTRQRRRIKDMESKLDKLLELAEQQHHAST
ncbi:hypothetical protein BOX15_Mlig002051g1 [Macrostomum lignano]|uniref:Uncharacterized protein n=2 Tax=Macrostomum lignano TaxID=282301 RepID=A0A267GWD8_9PLAT|nr:hypothetical protein BOX15_Mlig002051g1 [Macrostomum lignano]